MELIDLTVKPIKSTTFFINAFDRSRGCAFFNSSRKWTGLFLLNYRRFKKITGRSTNGFHKSLGDVSAF